MAPRFLYHILSSIVSLLPLWARCHLWGYLVLAGAQRWSCESATQRIPGGMYIKCGQLVRPAEAQAVRFVGAHTSLPVPVIIDTFTLENKTWIVMSRLPGYNLADAYTQITPEVEQVLSSQLTRILAPLRAIPPPSSAVCGFDQGPIYCQRMAFGAPPLGPFGDTQSFHEFLLSRARTLDIPAEENAELVHETIKRAHSRSHRLCLTHNDLGPHNILVDEDWNITGIVDWESCAWMPEYWYVCRP